jgi:hypothetical protein
MRVAAASILALGGALSGCGAIACVDTDNLVGTSVAVVDASGDPVRSALVTAALRDSGDPPSACRGWAGHWSCDDRQGTYDIVVRSPGFDSATATAEVTGDACDNDTTHLVVPRGPTCASYGGPQSSIVVQPGEPLSDHAVLTWAADGFDPEPCTPGDVAWFCGIDAVGPITVALVDGDRDVRRTVDVPMDGCNVVPQDLSLE